MGETEGKLCFVIMPFSGTESHTEEKWTEFFNEWIKPAVEGSNLGLFCERSHPTTGDVIRDIVRKLSSAEAVVAVLTDQSANVFWELGVRHSLRGTNTILFTERKRDIPSDLRTTCAWHLYSLRSRKEKQRFKTELTTLLHKVMSNPGKPDNPVAQFLEEEAESSVVDFEDETSFFNDFLGAIEKNKVGEMEKCLAYVNQTAHEKNKTLHYFKNYEHFYKRMEFLVQEGKIVLDYTFLFCNEKSLKTEQLKSYLKPYYRFANSISVLLEDRTRSSRTALRSSIGLSDKRRVAYVYERDDKGKMMAPRKIQGLREYEVWRQRYTQITMDAKTIFKRKKKP